MSRAAALLRSLAVEQDFTHVVDTRRSAVAVPVARPARGEGSLVLALFVESVYHAWTKDDPVYYGFVSVTHVQTGYYVDAITHPFATERAPDRPWQIPATPKGIALAEQLRQAYLALDVPWSDLPEDTAALLEIGRKVRALEPSVKVTAKIERDAARLFRAELKARPWPYKTKTQIASLHRELVRWRFFWTAKKPASPA